ncbi:MerR family transcriptional regulator [Roseomonas chloroacetimidivorans]|uniref:MerR family transcriptional regulator n=1 Tax=Roseomonas chloroacetimidivorans TaxID=1766656 RepID=UPI003C7668F0
MGAPQKSPGAFRTIGEVSVELGIETHTLRFWESKFPQLRPMRRSGQRRYYRPADIAVVRVIDRLLRVEGYTIAGARGALVREGYRAPSNGADVRAAQEGGAVAAARPVQTCDDVKHGFHEAIHGAADVQRAGQFARRSG